MNSTHDERVLLSRPYPVYWAGWETTTAMLQQAGWEISAEYEPYRMSYRLLMRHQGAQLYALTNSVNINHWQMMQEGRFGVHGIRFVVQYVCTHLTVNLMEQQFNFRQVDALPQMGTMKNVEEFGIFATPMTRTNEIIVPEENVTDLLGRLLEMQDEEKTRYYKQKLQQNRDGMSLDSAAPQQKFHAQILSIA